jgi:hypothetical protein
MPSVAGHGTQRVPAVTLKAARSMSKPLLPRRMCRRSMTLLLTKLEPVHVRQRPPPSALHLPR